MRSLARFVALWSILFVSVMAFSHAAGCNAKQWEKGTSLAGGAALACADSGIATYGEVTAAVHDGGAHFETITEAIVSGVLTAECVGKYIRDHWHDHDCADASGATCVNAGAIPSDEQRRANLLMKIASGYRR